MAGDLIADRYRLLEPLGRGSWSSVWLADDQQLDRRVAVKTLTPAADPARFRHEARAVALLSHPNICTLYDFGEDERTPFIVLEYLPGGSLEETLTPGVPLADGETHRIAAGLAAGLGHAHEHGLVHRDLKPANVLFDDLRRPKIADFGIARMIDTHVADRGGNGARHGVLHLAGAGRRDSCRPGKRRVLVWRHPVPDAHRPPAIQLAERDGARADAPRRTAAGDLVAAAGCARRARRCRLGGVEQGSGEPPGGRRGTRRELAR